MPADSDVLWHVVIAFALTYVLGFERGLRGSAAGDRTFSLIGIGSAVIGYLALNGAPNALAGAITGVGFIGSGLTLRIDRQRADGRPTLRGLTTAAGIFLAAAVGAAAGQGRIAIAVLATALSLAALEIRHIPVLRALDTRRWERRFRDDEDLPRAVVVGGGSDPGSGSGPGGGAGSGPDTGPGSGAGSGPGAGPGSGAGPTQPGGSATAPLPLS